MCGFPKQFKFKTNMANTFKVVFTPVENSFAEKPISQIDVSLFHYGQPKENREFKVPDENGDKTLLQAWRRECSRLNTKYPTLHHWIDTEQ